MLIRNRLTGVEAEVGDSDESVLGSEWDVVDGSQPKPRRKAAATDPAPEAE